PAELVCGGRDRLQVVVAGAALRSGTHVDLEVPTAEDLKEVTGESNVILDRLLPRGRIDEVRRLARSAVRAGHHRDLVPIQERLELPRPFEVAHHQAAVPLEPGKAHRRDQRHVLGPQLAEYRPADREVNPGRRNVTPGRYA